MTSCDGTETHAWQIPNVQSWMMLNLSDLDLDTTFCTVPSRYIYIYVYECIKLCMMSENDRKTHPLIIFISSLLEFIYG